MYKVNKFIVSMIAICVALLYSNVFATASANGETVSSAAAPLKGSGTKADPYILEFPNGNPSKVEVKYSSLPFYFEVLQRNTEVGRVYCVEFDSQEKVVTFTGLDEVKIMEDGSTDEAVLVSDEILENGPWQLGITHASGGNLETTPMYSIEEVASYYTTSRETEKEVIMVGESNVPIIKKNFSGLKGFSEIKKGEKGYITRTLELKNVSSNVSQLRVAKSDLYYFTYSRTKNNNINDLVTPLYYKDVTQNEDYKKYKEDGFSLYERELSGKETTTSYEYTYSDVLYIPNGNLADLSTDEYAAKIMYKFNGYSNTALNDNGEDVNSIEALVTKILLSIGDHLLLGSLQNILGNDLTIDALIFNRYDDTKIDLYNEGGSAINTVLRDVINNWFNVFAVLAYICYVVLLVYIAIMIIVSAGTEKQSKGKAYITNWIVGLALLYFIPKFGIPALLNINEALVNYMGNGRESLETYYNIYDRFQKGGFTLEYVDIFGSDSTTVSIEELEGRLSEVSDEILTARKELTEYTEKFIPASISDENTRAIIARGTYRRLFNNFDRMGYPPSGEQKSKDGYSITQYWNYMKRDLMEFNPQYFPDKNVMEIYVNAVLGYNNSYDEGYNYANKWYKLKDREDYKYVLEETIKVVQNDFMGEMRALAGRTHRLIYAIIWYMLIFQLIALVFLYYKRIFIIAILIAIFPLIMIFYCVDKMSDGSAQTLSMWFKELLANIFVQSVHAVIYTVLIEMGLEIYKNDNSNWILFVTAMLIIISAEGIMKSIFGLDGSTLGKMGGAFAKTAMAIGAAKTFLTARQTSKDENFQKKQNARFERLQNSQRRADNKATLRASRRAIKGKDASLLGKGRDGLYHVATDARKFTAKAAPKVSAVKRELKNTAAITAGMMYGLANGDIESMYAGAQMAKTATGRGKKLEDEERDIKTNLQAAYERKKKKK